MLGHLRSKALESFKSRLEQSLKKGEGFLHLFVLVLTLVCLSLTKDVQVVTNQILVSTAYTYLCRNYFCVNAYVACQP